MKKITITLTAVLSVLAALATSSVYPMQTLEPESLEDLALNKVIMNTVQPANEYEICSYNVGRDYKAINAIIEDNPQYLYSQLSGKPMKSPLNKFTHKDTLVVRTTEKTIGFVNYGFQKLDCFSIPILRKGSVNYIGIDKNNQKKGLGTTLLQEVVTYLKEQEATHIHLSVKKNNYNAQKLYENLGFQHTYSSSTGNMLYELRTKKGNIIQEHPKACLAVVTLGILGFISYLNKL